MYLDKLDGLVDAAFFKEHAEEWRGELARLQERMGQHRSADEGYVEEGLRVLELAQNAQSLFLNKDSETKRKIIEKLCSNSKWKDGKLFGDYRRPFDLVAVAVQQHKELVAAGKPENA